MEWDAETYNFILLVILAGLFVWSLYRNYRNHNGNHHD